MTDARLSGLRTQVAAVLPTTSVNARVSDVQAQVGMKLDGIEARISDVTVQVAVQTKRTWVTMFDGTPVRVWKDGTPVIVRTM